jgi:hypothetical protein
MVDALPKPIKATSSHFYRYQTAAHLDWLEPIILRHELYVPLVGQLNDPADGRPKLAQLTADQLFTFLYNKGNPTLTREAQHRVVSMLRQNIQLHGTDELTRRAAKMLHEHCERYRVYSLSKRWNNLNMWAKYAADHTGYCLEFVNTGDLFAHVVDVIYGDTLPMDVNNPEHRKAYFFYCKRQEWSNEEEVRLILMPGHGSKVKIEPQWLTHIILGKNMSSNDQKEIRQWAKLRQPELAVVQAFFDDLHQELRLRG